MNTNEIFNALTETQKGAHVQVCWKRRVKTAKNSAGIVEKVTCAWVRAGIDFAKMAANVGQEKHALPWGAWKNFPYVIEHKGEDYIRVYPAVFDNLKPSAEFLLNGIPVGYDVVKSHLHSSEKGNAPATCFSIKAENIQWVGQPA